VTESAEVWQLLIAAAVGFLVGSVNPATIVAKARGVNLRDIGSGNPGATNTARALGKRTGVIVGVLDVLKGLVPALAFSVWGPGAAGTAGLFAVLGHIFSPFLRGKGGKGTATTLGAVLGVEPIWTIPMLLAFGVTYAVTKRVGLGAVAGAAILIAIGLWWSDIRAEQLFAVFLGIIVIIRHESNLREAFAGRRESAGNESE
jgi:glycerol-3-phosphate acyltransferase PlsY